MSTKKKLSKSVHEPAVGQAVTVTGVPPRTGQAVTVVPPRTPTEDAHGKFQWMSCTLSDSKIISLQQKGFVVASEIANGYAFLRRERPDLSTHRFATASVVNVNVGGCGFFHLGACRNGTNYITRDVLLDSKGASLTMTVTETGVELYIFNGASVVVSFP